MVPCRHGWRRAAFPNSRYYEGRLANAPPTELHRGGGGGGGKAKEPYLLVDVPGVEEHNAAGSYVNQAEADLAAALVAELLTGKHQPLTAPPSAVGGGGGGGPLAAVVLTFYSGQVELLRRCIRQRISGDRQRDLPPLPAGRVEVHTVDSFQGSEADVVIISFVRAPQRSRGGGGGGGGGTVGFLKDYRRLNVALTRARRRLVLLAHAPTLRHGGAGGAFVDSRRRRRRRPHVPTVCLCLAMGTPAA